MSTTNPKCIICGAPAYSKRKKPIFMMSFVGIEDMPPDRRPYYCFKHSTPNDEPITIQEKAADKMGE